MRKKIFKTVLIFLMFFIVFSCYNSVRATGNLKEIMEEISLNQENAANEILESGFLDEAEKQAKKLVESVLYASGFEKVIVE